MDIANLEIGGEKFFVWIIIFLGVVLAVLTGIMVGTDAVTTVIVVLAIVLSIMWIVNARQIWWLLMPAGGALGGYFYFGFKLYPHEVALLGCLVPLAIARAVRVPAMLQKDRQLFPAAMYFLSAYLFAHWLGSNLYNQVHGEGGYGNVTRAYFDALWVIIFVFAFRRYGSTKHIPTALTLIYLAAFARVSAALVIYLTNAFAYVPVVNYVLPGSTHSRFADLRTSGLTLATVATCYFLIHKGLLRRTFHGLIFMGSFVALLFGSGRGSLILLCIVPILAALLYRKVIPMLLSFLAAGSLLFVLNSHPALLDNTPFAVQRAASILLLKKAESARYGRAESSDEWHARLREVGYKKWTQSWSTFLFGTGIRPYDYASYSPVASKTTVEELLESSSKVGAYESGWWTVIAVTGLLGLISYVGVLLYLLRRLVPILLKDKVRDHRHAFALMGVFGILNWLLLGWGNGGFPSTEIMFGFIPFFALEDTKRRNPRPEHRRQELLTAQSELTLHRSG